MNHKDYRHLLAYAATVVLLLGCAESEKITEDKPTTEPRSINFSIDVSQDWYAQNPGTRAILERSQPRHIEMQCSDGSTAYLLETTRTGIDKPLSSLQVSEVRSADGLETRASLVDDERTGMSSFSSFCYKSGGTSHYLNEQTSNTGALSTKKYWPEGENSLRFYAVHPYDANHFTTSSATALSYAFTSSADVEAQTDLMYASTDLVGYTDATSRQYIPLHFKHALTAVQFKLGSTNSDFNAGIHYIKLKNVYTSGTLTLPSASTDNTTNADATWTNLGTQTDVILDNIGFIARPVNAGNLITKGGKTEYFLMIPQDLNGVGIEIGFANGTKFAATLTGGSWTGGTTVQYTISDARVDWDFTFDITIPNITYTANSATYGIVSYRQNKETSEQVPVEWKITGYSTDGGTTYTDTPPAWITSLSLTSGSGGTERQVGVATIDAKSYIEETCSLKIARDESLQDDDNKKGFDTRYDLSMHDVNGNSKSMTTANCYVISGYGHYKLPLVYGNAMKDGAVNASSYTTSNTGNYILRSFRNYKDTRITNPWIQESGGTPTSAYLVWSDVSADVVTFPSSAITTETINGQQYYYLNFDIAKEKIESGNAVVAVKDEDGIVMWSWHLWFAPKEVLDVTTVNSVGITQEALGLKVPSQTRSQYNGSRSVILRIRQRESGTVKYQGFSQSSGSKNVHASTTLYQWGRKDAFPGVADSYPTYDSENPSAGGFYEYETTQRFSYATSIQNPGTFYRSYTSSWNGNKSYTSDWHGNDTINTVYNAWAADITSYSSNYATSSVVKTVYDPCPAGYKIPSIDALSGFNGGWTSLYESLYYGRPFNSEISLFFPAPGYRNNIGLSSIGQYGCYWFAVPGSEANTAWDRMFYNTTINGPDTYRRYRYEGKSIRPVQE